MSVGLLSIQVPTESLVVLLMTRITTVSGPPGTPVKECSKVYQPDATMCTGRLPGLAGNAPHRVPLLLPEITKPSGSVPALKTKSRRCPPAVLLMADDQSNRLSR